MANSNEQILNSLKIHKVPNFALWKSNYEQTNGIGGNDLVAISPFELEDFFKEKIYTVGISSENDIIPSNGEIHLDTTYLSYIKQKNVFYLKVNEDWEIFLPPVLESTDPNFGRELTFVINDMLQDNIIDIKAYGDFSSGVGQFDVLYPIVTEADSYQLSQNNVYLKIKEVEYEDSYLGTDRARGTWAILQDKKESEESTDVFIATYNETTYQQIKNAFDDGKLCVVKEVNSDLFGNYNYSFYYLKSFMYDTFLFVIPETEDDTITSISINNSTGWGEIESHDPPSPFYTFSVTIEDNSIITDETSSSLNTVLQTGKILRLWDNTNKIYANLTYHYQSGLFFTATLRASSLPSTQGIVLYEYVFGGPNDKTFTMTTVY